MTRDETNKRNALYYACTTHGPLISEDLLAERGLPGSYDHMGKWNGLSGHNYWEDPWCPQRSNLISKWYSTSFHETVNISLFSPRPIINDATSIRHLGRRLWRLRWPRRPRRQLPLWSFRRRLRLPRSPPPPRCCASSWPPQQSPPGISPLSPGISPSEESGGGGLIVGGGGGGGQLCGSRQ